MLRVVASVLQWCANGCNNSRHCCANNVAVVCKRMQQLPTLLRQRCCVLLRPCCSSVQTDATMNSQQHATTCNKVCKRTQHITFNNVGSCWSTMLLPFTRGLINNRELKQLQWRRQRERKKSNRFRRAKPQLCTCITLFFAVTARVRRRSA